MSEKTNVKIAPGSKPYTPYGGAKTLFYNRDGEILYEGPAGTGKTRALLEKFYYCCCTWPNTRALLVRKTRASMTESVLVTLEDDVLPAGAISGKASRSHRHSYDLPNGSSMVVGGLDNPDRIMSTEYDLIAVFEATEATEDDIEKLSSRLERRDSAIPFNQMVCDCNPQQPTHFLNQRGKSGLATRILSRHEDNPTLYNHATKDWTDRGQRYLARLDKLTGARHARLRKGIWAAQEGLVYPEFDPAIHVLPSDAWPDLPTSWRDIPPAWERTRSIDFGYRNPFVCQWWAKSPDGLLVMYREIYYSNRRVEEHAEQILAIEKEEREYFAEQNSGKPESEQTDVPRCAYTVSDHDAEDRATLEARGIITLGADKRIRPGVDAVEGRLKKDERGMPGVFFLRDALVETDPRLADDKKPCSTLQEFEGYVYPTGKPDKEEKEAPVKRDDHGMDAMRYRIMREDGEPKVRFEVW